MTGDNEITTASTSVSGPFWEEGHAFREHTSVNDSRSSDTLNLQFVIHDTPNFFHCHARGRSRIAERVHPLPYGFFSF